MVKTSDMCSRSVSWFSVLLAFGLAPVACHDPSLSEVAPPVREVPVPSISSLMPLLESEFLFMSERNPPWPSGTRLEVVGDVDGDGVGDVAVVSGVLSAAGRRIDIVSGSTSRVLRSHRSRFDTRVPLALAALGDWNEDGCDDYVIAEARPSSKGGLVVESYSGREGMRMALREIDWPRLAWIRLAAGSAEDNAFVVLRAGAYSGNHIVLPVLLLQGKDLGKRSRLGRAGGFRNRRRAVLTADWRSDGNVEVVLVEKSRNSDEWALVNYDPRDGSLRECLTQAELVQSARRLRDRRSFPQPVSGSSQTAGDWGAELVNADGSLILNGPLEGSVLSIDLRTGKRRFVGEYGVLLDELWGLLPVEDFDQDGSKDLLLWGLSRRGRQPRSSWIVLSGATGALLSE